MKPQYLPTIHLQDAAYLLATWNIAILSSPDYYYSDFISLQGSVDRAILAELGKADVEEDIDFYFERFPYPPYRDDVFVFVIQMQFPFIILLSFIVTAPSISKDIVLEKERKLKVCHVSPLLICRAVLLGLNLLTPSNKLLKLGHVRGQGSLSTTWSPFTFLILISAWISNYIHFKVWDEIASPFQTTTVVPLKVGMDK